MNECRRFAESVNLGIGALPGDAGNSCTRAFEEDSVTAGSTAVPEWLARTAWEAGGAALLFVDRSGMVRYWNQVAARLYLLPDTVPVGVPFHHLFPPHTLIEAESAHRAVSLGGTLEWQGPRRRTDGVPLWIAATWSATFDAEGNRAGMLEQAREETERQHELNALRASEALLAHLVETAGDGLLAFDAEGRIVFANRAAGTLLGLSSRQLLSRRFDSPEWNWNSGGRNGFGFLAVTRTGEPLRDFEMEVQRGDSVPVALRGEAVCWHPSTAETSGQPPGVIVSLRDETIRRRAEVAERQRQERELLTRRLLAVEEAERRRIAAELHDELGAMLSGLRWLLESATPPTTPGAETLPEARELAADALARTRDLCLDLRPASLDELGLAAACQALAQRLERRSGLRVELHAKALPIPLPEPTATAAYRIVQEALTNVARHSGASKAKVTLTVEGGLLRITIHDNGRGFEPLTAPPTVQSSGLSGMQDRAQTAGGSLEISSAAGAGTTLTAEFPLVASAAPVVEAGPL